MKASETIRRYLQIVDHNTRRVAEWYTPEMEVQVNVFQGSGEKIDTDNRAIKYGKLGVPYEWFNFRLPRNADSEPIDNDFTLNYPLNEHVDAIGMTGWNWKQQVSVRVGFDYDSITGHAKGVGLADDDLKALQEKCAGIPEVLMLTSTGGKGIHIYFEFDPANLPNTKNHKEHAALALACLADLSRRVGFDFQAGLDVGGGVMWIWARKMTADNHGLTILKDNTLPGGERAYYMVPTNWQDYLDVVSRKRARPRVPGFSDDEQDLLDEKVLTREKTSLTVEQQEFILTLQADYPNYTTVWLEDHGLLQTHTQALKLYHIAHNLVGTFDTLSEGRDPGKPNVFGYPLPSGGWRFSRFGKGTREAECWNTADKNGWTWIYYNSPSDLDGVAKFFRGIRHESKGYVFGDTTTAKKAVRAMGGEVEFPTEFGDRKVRLTPVAGSDKTVSVEVERIDRNEVTPEGWLARKGKNPAFYKIVDVACFEDTKLSEETLLEIIDEHARAMVNTDGTAAGWSVKHEDGRWMPLTKDDARSALTASPVAANEDITSLLGKALKNAWTVVNLPFQPEYPGGRKWNIHGAQFKIKPADLPMDVMPVHPHWDMVFSHCGEDLTKYLKDLSWAQRNHIDTGRDYLMQWVACMLREPFQPLPYLFLWGPQNSGKSILHEAISLLMTKGVVKADTALTSRADFNGEIAGSILCVVEEKDISKSGTAAYNKLKEWVTAVTLSIHAKFKQVYTQPNTTHWIQLSNEKDHCVVFPGDTRITCMYVAPLIQEIPKLILLQKLEEEAPQFLASLLRLNLPDVHHRMRLPVVATASKDELELASRTPLERFLSEHCYYVPGASVSITEFRRTAASHVEDGDKSSISTEAIRKKMPADKFPIGRLELSKSKEPYIGNISFEPVKPETNVSKVFVRGTNADVIILQERN